MNEPFDVAKATTEYRKLQDEITKLTIQGIGLWRKICLSENKLNKGDRIRWSVRAGPRHQLKRRTGRVLSVEVDGGGRFYLVQSKDNYNRTTIERVDTWQNIQKLS